MGISERSSGLAKIYTGSTGGSEAKIGLWASKGSTSSIESTGIVSAEADREEISEPAYYINKNIIILLDKYQGLGDW